MKQPKSLIWKFSMAGAALVITTLLFSFTLISVSIDSLKQLGISKTDADAKIISSILGGSFDQSGLRNAKNIVSGNRAAVMKDVMLYAKTFVSSPAFLQAYNDLRQQQKPEKRTIQTPEQMQNDMIEQSKKGVAEMEASAQKADPSLKPMFEKMLLDAKKQLKEAEDPNNKMIANYRKNYAQAAKDVEKTNESLVAEWEAKYPANHHQFLKIRMQQFLAETSDVDYTAQLFEKKGIKYFVNKNYESKGNHWKMAFRAGKEVVEPTRVFVQQWIEEIK